MTFMANTFGFAAPPASTTSVMFFWLAEANTSAGAPLLIWVASAELAAKLNLTVAPGCAASNCWPSCVNDSVNEAAANTVICPDNDGEDGEDGDDGELPVVGDDPEPELPSSS